MFDKRKRKRGILKYLVIFLVAFPPVVLFNVYIARGLENWIVIFLDVLILLAFAGVGNLIANKIFKKKDEKLEKKIKMREEANRQKQLILEASYKAKRDKKKLEKSELSKKTIGENNEESNKQSK